MSDGNKSQWNDLILHNPEAFINAFRRGGVNTDDLQPPETAGKPAATTGLKQHGITSSFSPSTGVLTTTGDDQGNAITFTRDAAGNILVNDGKVHITGGKPTVANTSLFQAYGQGGDDVITLNEANGALPRANLFGGAGNDTLTGGSGADMLFGQAGNDTLIGKGGTDYLFGGSDNDVLIGGDGNDQMYGEAGDDRMIWNPGDDSDLMEGGIGTDTAEVNAGNGNEIFTVTANGTRVRVDRLDPAPFNLDIGTTENLVVNLNGGDDQFSATGNLAALISLTVDGGAGNDTILGGNGADVLRGGTGNDFVDGNQGNDVVDLGDGDDRFQWDPGDGNDTVDGGAGADAVTFNGSNIAETIGLAAAAGRVTLNRDVANIAMDMDGIETVDIAVRGGADRVSIGDMTGTDVTRVNVDLAASPGGAGDAAIDTVTAGGSNGADVVDVVASGDAVSVVGLSALVAVDGVEATDRIVVNGLGGNDTINASTVAAGIVDLTIDGGAGDDTIIGSQGADTLYGGDGNDFVSGQQGNDVAYLGSGDDVFQWNPGNGSDTVEGGDGVDTLAFFGANIGEQIDIAANGGRINMTRNIGTVAMSLDDVEQIDFRALGGADSINVGDLGGTDVARVSIDLAGPNGGGDGAADVVRTQGSASGDAIAVAGAAGAAVTVTGLAAQIRVANAEAGLDRLIVDGGAGNDTIDASGLASDVIQLEISGGLGNDTITGSAGADLITGGDGNDVIHMGAGDDVFTWNPGDDNDTVEGDAGYDTLQFNGANIAESIAISGNGDRVQMTRDIAGVTMDLEDVERINFRALGGADHITINDLSGTGVDVVNVDLRGGVADADIVTVGGSSYDDVITVVGDAAGVGVTGLAARVDITGAEAAYDRLVVLAGDGDDVIDATFLAADGIHFTADGGKGNDVLLGGAGGDILIGGDGDDVLIGGDGDDVLDGGPGDDILIGGAGNDILLNGEYTVADFTAGADRVDLRALSGLTFEWLMEHASMVDGNAVLDLGNGEHITLSGVAVDTLHRDDFILAT